MSTWFVHSAQIKPNKFEAHKVGNTWDTEIFVLSCYLFGYLELWFAESDLDLQGTLYNKC